MIYVPNVSHSVSIITSCTHKRSYCQIEITCNVLNYPPCCEKPGTEEKERQAKFNPGDDIKWLTKTSMFRIVR